MSDDLRARVRELMPGLREDLEAFRPDVVFAWPRPEGAMAGNPGLVEAVAARLHDIHAL